MTVTVLGHKLPMIGHGGPNDHVRKNIWHYAGLNVPAHRKDAGNEFVQHASDFLRANLPKTEAESLIDVGVRLRDPIQRMHYFDELISAVEAKNVSAIAKRVVWLREPVGIREFVMSDQYLDKADEVYPIVLEELVEMNAPMYQEIVLTGGIGSAKTSCALYTLLYQLYLLSCLKSPHEQYGLDSSDEILMVFQSLNAKTAKNSYERFSASIDRSVYFQENFKPDKDITSKLVFPNRIEVVPVSGSETAAIGQNVIGGLIDELNYMQIVDKSKQNADGGQYDQAVALYNSIARRRKSRFMYAGAMPGKLCLVSSKRYPGQFTDIKEAEARTDKTIYIYDKRVWDVKPEGSFSGKWFKVFTGTESKKPRVLFDDEVMSVEDTANVMSIPVEFRADFDKDIINALREIAGVSTLARHPFFIETERVKAAFGHHGSVFTHERVDFVETKLGIIPERFFKPELPRWVHIDHGLTNDSAGIAIATVVGFKSMIELGFIGEELLPQVRVDGILEVSPPKNGEILFWKIRAVIAKLRELGLNIRWVSFDSFESTDSMQLLRQAGFQTGYVSMDVSTEPYDYLKSLTYTGSVKMPTHHRCYREMVSLEKDTKRGKIDHPANGSKDCSDALAGAVFGITHRREIWMLYDVLNRMSAQRAKEQKVVVATPGQEDGQILESA